MVEPDIWDITFPAGEGFDFEDLPIPIINCLDDGQVEQVEKAIAVIRLRSGVNQASAWLTLFEQILHIRQFICSQEKKISSGLSLLAESLIKDSILDLPENCIGIKTTFLGTPLNFQVRTSLSLQAPAKFNFGGVCFLEHGGYTVEQKIEREINFFPCAKSARKTLIYLLPRVNMRVEAITEI